MSRFAAYDFRRIQSFGLIGLPRRVDVGDLEIELERVPGANGLIGLRQLKAGVITQFDDHEIFSPRVGARADRLEELDGVGKIGDGQPQMRQRDGGI